MRTDAQHGIVLHIVVGILEAFLGGLIFRWFGYAGTHINSSSLSVTSVVVSLAGASILLAVANLFRRGSIR